MSNENQHKFGAAAILMFLIAGLSLGFQAWYQPPQYDELDQIAGTVKDIYLKERADESDNSVYVELIVGDTVETLCNPPRFISAFSKIEIGGNIEARGERHHSVTQCTFYPWEVTGGSQIFIDYSEHINHQEEGREKLTRLIKLLVVLGIVFAMVELIKFNKAKQAGTR